MPDTRSDSTLGLAHGRKPAFLITIDTEGDNIWARRLPVTTRNAEYLPRFQQLCEKYALKPTYLTNYEMAISPFFREFAEDALRRGMAEVGMHLHAWHSPPEFPLTADDNRFHPYLTEYPETVMRGKVAAITDLLEETFRVKMLTHRGGRWAFDKVYARILVAHGYRVDCTVTPGVSWKGTPGRPDGEGGADYTGFPVAEYFLDLDDISRPGHSSLLEVPVTILRRSPTVRRLCQPVERVPWGKRAAARLFPDLNWLRPDGRNGGVLLKIVDQVLLERRPYAEFMLHSSEFMPGGSPRFPDERSIDHLYGHLEALFERVQGRFSGATMAEYCQDFVGEPKPKT
jgi:hypothetical protein